MVDYKKFLGKPDEELVAIHLGGPTIETADRRFRLQTEGVAPALLAPGFLRVRVRGRNATPVAREPSMDLTGLPSRSGHHAGGYLATNDGRFTRLELLPEGELELCAPVRGRVHAGSLVFDEVLFETEIEMAVREALLDGRGIADQKGVAASLRAAFAASLALRVAARAAVPLSPNEARGAIHAIAEGGEPVAQALVERIREQRRAEETAALARRAAARGRPAPAPARRDPAAEAERILTAAGAVFRSARSLGDGTLEVRYHFLGERFVTVVDEATFNVIDAGLCLSGADRELGLDAMPSVIREAMDVDHLNITRW